MRDRIFYGWWVLAGIFASYTALVGVQVYTLPLFYPELTAEFGWSKQSISYAATIFFLTGASITPFVSSLFDRYSARIFMIAGGCITVLGLLAYRSMETLTHLTVIYIVLAFSQVCAGQVPTILVVTRWFRRYRGIAVGITLTGTSIGGAVFPLVFNYVMENGGWRDAITVFLILCAVMMLLPYIFLVRSRPEDKGLPPDGDEAAEAKRSSQKNKIEGPTMKEALRNPAFYILALATGALWFTMNGIYNNQSFFMSEELGLPRSTYSLIFSAIFWFAIAGKLLFGHMSDRLDKISIMILVVILLLTGLFFLRLSSTGNLMYLYAYAAVFGLGFGGTFTLIQLVIAEFFAGHSYGKILGVLTAVDVACGGLGISVIAEMERIYGSYLPVLEMLMGLTSVVAVMVVVLYRIRRNQAKRLQPATVVPDRCP
ncbi:MAG: MFS transporter [Acidobacteria bacterium]|nr:MFS transporter [Acidobacteriota bacterium]